MIILNVKINHGLLDWDNLDDLCMTGLKLFRIILYIINIAP